MILLDIKPRRPFIGNRIVGVLDHLVVVSGLPARTVATGLRTATAYPRIQNDGTFYCDLDDGIYKMTSGDGYQWLFVKGRECRKLPSEWIWGYTIRDYMRDVNKKIEASQIWDHAQKLGTEDQAWRHLWSWLESQLAAVPNRDVTKKDFTMEDDDINSEAFSEYLAKRGRGVADKFEVEDL